MPSPTACEVISALEQIWSVGRAWAMRPIPNIKTKRASFINISVAQDPGPIMECVPRGHTPESLRDFDCVETLALTRAFLLYPEANRAVLGIANRSSHSNHVCYGPSPGRRRHQSFTAHSSRQCASHLSRAGASPLHRPHQHQAGDH